MDLAGLVGADKEKGRKRKIIYTTRTQQKFERTIVRRAEFFNADGSGFTTDNGSAQIRKSDDALRNDELAWCIAKE